MTDRVYASSKPTANGTAAAPVTATAGGGGNPTNPAYTKANLYNPNTHPSRRPPQYNRRRRHGRSLCCCCCFWTILAILILALIATTVGAVLYLLYNPHRPVFSITSLRIAKLNLTASPDSNSHLTTLFNLTLMAKNPNNHVVYFFDPFTITAFSGNSVQIGNGSIPAFTADKNNQTSFRAILTDSQDLDTESVTSLRSDLKKKRGFPITIEMDTMVKLNMEWMKSKKIGIRVICEGIKGTVPTGKSPSVASVADSACKVDIRIKIWRFTLH